MNVPHASHMGGVWERQIPMVQSVPASLLERHGGQLDDESLKTFMVEAEAIVNCRPLTVDSISSSQFSEPLTPNHLLTRKSKVVLRCFNTQVTHTIGYIIFQFYGLFYSVLYEFPFIGTQQ